MEEFSCKTKIISGTGAVSTLKNLGAKRLFLVTDPYFMKNGQAGQVAECTGCKEVEYFDKVVPDPGVELAAEGRYRVALKTVEEEIVPVWVMYRVLPLL